MASGAAYDCYCTPEELDAVRHEQERKHEAPRYNGRCLSLTDADLAAFAAEDAVRRCASASPEKVRFDDLIRGEVEFDNALLGDFVIVRSNGMPLYHFVVVVDDEAMGITHVVRGEDHSNTPKHIALIEALGYREPKFGHIPLILNPDRTKMSKRKSQTAITAYREQGYLPEAMATSSPSWAGLGTEEEIFSPPSWPSASRSARSTKRGGLRQGSARLPQRRYIRSLADGQLALRLRPFLPDRLDDGILMPGAAPQGAAGAPRRRHRARRLPDRDRRRSCSPLRARPALAKGRSAAETAAPWGWRVMPSRPCPSRTSRRTSWRRSAARRRAMAGRPATSSGRCGWRSPVASSRRPSSARWSCSGGSNAGPHRCRGGAPRLAGPGDEHDPAADAPLRQAVVRQGGVGQRHPLDAT